MSTRSGSWRRTKAASAALPRGDGVVVLDLAVTPELEAEGLARDLVRLVQQARRDAGLDVSDRIDLAIGTPDEVRRRLEPFADMVAGETLAVAVRWVEPAPGAALTAGRSAAQHRGRGDHRTR